MIPRDPSMQAPPKPGLDSARDHLRRGNPAAAERECKSILKASPDDSEALSLLGQLFLRSGRAAKAVDVLGKAVAVMESAGAEPEADLLVALGGARHEAGDARGALEAFEAALAREPESADARYWRAESMWRLGRRDEAIADLRTVMERQPDYPRAASNLGAALHQAGDVAGALDVLQKAIELRPGDAAAHYNYGLALKDSDQADLAAEALRRSLKLAPNNLPGHIVLSSVLFTLALPDEAEQVAARGLSMWPDNTALLSYQGSARLARGDAESARAVLRRALEIDPACIPAHAYFAQADGDLDDPSRIVQIEAALAAGGLQPHEAGQLHFTAGRRCLVLGHDDEAFTHYEKGNEYKRQALALLGRTYKPATEESVVNELIRGFSREAFARPGGSQSEKPVFIVGMPRSGTSLVEQILASHAQVAGAGELVYVNNAAAQLRRDAGYSLAPPPEAALRETAEAYLARIRERAGEAERITDKMPTNFRNLGLIALLFPNARVIHVKRDPMDTGLSCFFQNFYGTGNAFVYDLAWFAHYYREYLRLMDHWRSVLPLRMLEIDYEALIADQEGVSRTLVEFLSLEWDEACLAFHKTERPVVTASLNQVRRPIYNSSVGAWRRFEKQLAPLARELAAGPNGGPGKQETVMAKAKEKPVVVGDNPSFADILHPMTPEAFFAEYYDKKHLHIRGGAEKFANVMSWEILTGILNMTAAWSSESLQLVIDRDIVPARGFCRTAQNRDNREVQQPDAEKVMALLRAGASLVANDIDSLTPALRGFSAALEKAVSGKAQANLYCSWRERQAFDSHFDTHDVYAVHVAGEKLWRIYETRADRPIAHAMFKSYGQEWHDKSKGAVAEEILMKPGDLLYLPRGLYHDALATSDGTIHIAFGLTHVIGVDVMSMLQNIAVADPAFRANMPRPEEGEEAARSWLAGLGERLARHATRKESLEAMRQFQRDHRYPRGGFDLPVRPAGRRFAVRLGSVNVEQRDGVWMLASAKGAVPIPPGLEDATAWVVGRKVFSEGDLADSFPGLSDELRKKLLDDLSGMKVVAVQS